MGAISVVLNNDKKEIIVWQGSGINVDDLIKFYKNGRWNPKDDIEFCYAMGEYRDIYTKGAEYKLICFEGAGEIDLDDPPFVSKYFDLYD